MQTCGALHNYSVYFLLSSFLASLRFSARDMVHALHALHYLRVGAHTAVAYLFLS